MPRLFYYDVATGLEARPLFDKRKFPLLKKGE